jgi:hypothetical protein
MKFSFFLVLILLKISLTKEAMLPPKAHAKKSLDEMSDAELEKMMKDYDLNSKDMGILSSGVQSHTTKSKSALSLSELTDDPLKSLLGSDKKNMNPDQNIKIQDIYLKNKEILKSFDLKTDTAVNLMSYISHYNILNKLPVTAMNIVNQVSQKEKYKKLKPKPILDMTYMISNTLNSQAFVDHENKIARKGMLTMISKDSGEINQVWAVLNSKVFCFYNSSNYLNIVKIYRVSMIHIRDSLLSPCFFIYYDKEFVSTQSLVCALNYREKELWLNLLQYNQDIYKNYEIN